MKPLQILLYPFAILYDVITRMRNNLYDTGRKPSAQFDVPVISIGNLAVGGTGKTPMVEYLIRLLHNDFTIASLSRGYGRKTKGFRIATPSDTPETIGDEPLQLYRKFGSTLTVAVGEERALAIPSILDQKPQTNLILLDDAFQHRRVTPSFQILLTDFNNLFVDDYLLPAGRLRESRKGARRADAIIVTKCPPDISVDTMMEIESAIRKYSLKPVFFAEIGYGNTVPMNVSGDYFVEKVVLVSGIANADPLDHYVRHNFRKQEHLRFPDHHLYTEADFNRIVEVASREGAAVLTTEKDAVKLDARVARYTGKVPFFYLPIEVSFIKTEMDFDEMIVNALKIHAV